MTNRWIDLTYRDDMSSGENNPIYGRMKIDVNLRGLTADLERKVLSAAELVSHGVTSSETNDTESNEQLSSAWIWLQRDPPIFESLSQKKGAFQHWLILCGFRSCAEVLSEFLEGVRSVCAVWSMVKGDKAVEIVSDTYNELMVIEKRKFGSMHLPEKTDFLKRNYDFKIPPEQKEYLWCIHRTRNCLVHDDGIISSKNCNEPNRLVIKWLGSYVYAEDEAGRKRQLTPPAMVRAGERAALELKPAYKRFSIGSQIEFSPQEFSEICVSLILISNEISQYLGKWGRERGVIFKQDESIKSDSI